MALSTPPPQPDPPSSTTTTSAAAPAAVTRPLFTAARPLTPQHPFYTRLPSNPNPNYPQLAPRQSTLHPLPPHPQDPSQLLYPVASSGRGFLHRPVAQSRPAPPPGYPRPPPPFGFPHPDPSYARPAHFQHTLLASVPGSNASSANAMPGVVKGVPVTSPHHAKVGQPPTTVSDTNNGYKDLRDRNKDDNFAVIRNRKVRLSNNTSLYALCRSWMRNGFPEETQPQYLDAVKSLPSPLPLASQEPQSPTKSEGDKEEEDKGDGTVDNLPPQELLQRHIKRAKRVRSRLREERLQRIARYKTRLALLLPPMVEQHLRNESAAGN